MWTEFPAGTCTAVTHVMKLNLITSTAVTLEFLLYQTGGSILQDHRHARHQAWAST